MQVSLVFKQITVRHFNIWGWWITSPLISRKMSMAAVFLDIEKAYDITWHSGLPYKLSELEFTRSLIKLIASFLTDWKFKVWVEGRFSTPRKEEEEGGEAGVPYGSILSTIFYGLYINYISASPWTHLTLIMDNTCIYVTETGTFFSLQIAMWPHCSGFTVWALEHKRLMKGKLRQFVFPESLTMYCN
jgi:hypothetical protein